MQRGPRRTTDIDPACPVSDVKAMQRFIDALKDCHILTRDHRRMEQAQVNNMKARIEAIAEAMVKSGQKVLPDEHAVKQIRMTFSEIINRSDILNHWKAGKSLRSLSTSKRNSQRAWTRPFDSSRCRRRLNMQ